jgi:hypothetical protein
MNFDSVPFPLDSSFLLWLIVVGSATAIVLIVSLLATIASVGANGPVVFANELGAMVGDLFSLSPRRVFALAQLTFREAYRRKALMVFVVFAILLMFAGWFLTSSNLQPEFQVKVYVSFVLRAISWLVLPVVLLLACWGIPEDIKLRSMHTVVTKPARRLELVLGRMLGYSFIGLAVLAVMGVVGWGWIKRQLPEAAKSQLICRQPIHGELSFRDREGNDKDERGERLKAGINVGDVWMFHSFIEGATKARAIWTFTGVGDHVLDGEGNLMLENRFQAFRSHKGDMKRAIYFQYIFFNPETGNRAPYELKTVEENRGRTDRIPRKFSSVGSGSGITDRKSYDIIDDFVTKDGTLTVEVACIDPGQYLGMARPDLFVRTADLPFESGYFKAVACIGMMLLVVIFMGVSVSTFVKGPVATFLVFCVVIVSYSARDFMGTIVGDEIALQKAAQYSGHQDKVKLEGGGVLESIYRILWHMNPTTELPEGPATMVMKTIDSGMVNFLWLVYRILPNFDYFTESLQYVANGFDVRFDSCVLGCIMITLAYFGPCVLLGYFALRIRELEAK